jgi:soluble lytic murein transglycosylase-like protein
MKLTNSCHISAVALGIISIGWLMTGCAAVLQGPPPPQPPILETIRLLDPPLAPEGAPQSDSSTAIAPDGGVPPDIDSLDFARTVLKREASRKMSVRQREAVARTLVGAESEYGIPVVLTLAIMRQESRFDPSAKGPAGSIGLMQLKPSTARETAKRYGIGWKSDRTLLDPEQNTRLGLAYLAELQRDFGGTEHAVAAYNIGPARLRRLLLRGPLRRGPYLTKVYDHVDSLLEQYGR